MFYYQVKKWICSFAAVLGGLDALFFSGGIGENAPLIRARICERLSFIGVELNELRNAQSEGVLSWIPVGLRLESFTRMKNT